MKNRTMQSEQRRNYYHVIEAVTFLLLLLVWCLFTYGGFVDKIFLPSPGDVIHAFVQMAKDGTLLSYTSISIYRVMVGWVVAVIVAVPVGILISTSKIGAAIVQPLIEFMRYLPVVALVPLTLLYFGIGDSQKFMIIFLGTFFQLVLMVSDVVTGVSRDLLRASATLGCTRLQSYRLVLLPAALPGILDNMRITIGWAWTYLVVAELVAADSGLGYMVLKAQRFLQTDVIFTGLIIIGVVGLLTDYIFKVLTRRIVPWRERVDG